MARIFIADDDQAILDATALVLELEGHQVHRTSRGQILASPDYDVPDLYVLDVRMSGCDGITLSRQLRQKTADRHIPIILFSANRNVAQLAHEAGADDYLVKPFDLQQLLDKVNACITAQPQLATSQSHVR